MQEGGRLSVGLQKSCILELCESLKSFKFSLLYSPLQVMNFWNRHLSIEKESGDVQNPASQRMSQQP